MKLRDFDNGWESEFYNGDMTCFMCEIYSKKNKAILRMTKDSYSKYLCHKHAQTLYRMLLPYGYYFDSFYNVRRFSRV